MSKIYGVAQARAYENRHKIKIGDAFKWHFIGDYGTSGQLPPRYMPVSRVFQGDKIMKVCRVYEGRNGYGPFVDYCLNETGLWYGKMTDCLIINGPDAFKMERVDHGSDLQGGAR